MTRRRRRLTVIAIALVILGAAAALGLSALRDSVAFFVTPSELATKPVAAGVRLRIGGLVKAGSVVRDGTQIQFAVTDGGADLAVQYRGLLPDLFRESQGIVAEGTLDNAGLFRADTVLAKHDENYIPREVADSLKKQGLWREGQGVAPK
jgi:cytochrome c-type biogenesis protein CcmE